MKNELSYLDRIVKFRKEAKNKKFSCSIKEVYSSLLVIFNSHDWDNLIKITYEDIKSESNLSLNSIKRAMKELSEFGQIDYRSKQGSRYLYCCLDNHLPDDMSYDKLAKLWVKSQKKYAKKSSSSEPDDSPLPQSPSADTPTPTSSPGPKGGVIRRQPPSPPSNETYSPDGDHPPDDGVPRNWDDLKRNLSELNIPPGDYQKIVQLSNYGQIAHPVWKAFHEIGKRKGTKDAVKNPGSWIQWYINQAPQTVTAPATPAPSMPPEPPKFFNISDFNPPDDGIERDWDKLKSRLIELKCTSRLIVRIALLSDYGKIGNSVWDALDNLTEKNIKDAGPWISNYIQEHPS